MNLPFLESSILQSRREFLLNSGMGLGTAALASLVPQLGAAAEPGSHHRPRAKRVIFLFMAGAPSQVDLFDYKPDLHKYAGTALPKSISAGQRVTAMTLGKEQIVAPSKFKFSRQGKSGVWMSELLPHLSTMADDLCLIHSFNTNAINHDPGKTSFCTGTEIPGKASMGAWLSYGLGTLNKDLPDFVVMPSARWSGKVNVQALYARLWGSGFLPSKHQGTSFQTTGDPVLFLSNPKGVDAEVRRRMLDTLGEVNHKHFGEVGDPEIQTTISQQEMAFRMQTSVPELADISDEPKEVLEMYGPEVNNPGSYARNCLLARRMAERDVRLCSSSTAVGITTPSPREPHGPVPRCGPADRGLAEGSQDARLARRYTDCLRREFGRTVYGQGKITPDSYGRDHHPRCFSGWLAGGGIKGRNALGETDDFSYNVVKDPVHVRDLHATMLHLLGLDHSRLIFPFQGLDQKLTGVEPSRVVREILM